MTIPKGVQAVKRHLSEMVMEMFPAIRWHMTAEETELAVHLRGNERLYKSLCALLEARLTLRSKVPEPTDPVQCKSMVARDRELQWLLVRLDNLYRSPVQQPNEGEPPA